MCKSLFLIYDWEFQDLEIFRKIRNEFAYNMMCSFEDQMILDLAKNLKTGMQYVDTLPVGDKGRVDQPKSRFNMVASSIITSLYNRAHYVSEKKAQSSHI